ncbi:hypothetical protein MHU86_14478 [Fragilaria crotonensis]|nr:hypothetical protein MHU86_14478 [Fragilaria crotonensis]
MIKRYFEYVAELQRSMSMRESKPQTEALPYSVQSFFRSERAKLVKAKRKLGFSDMAKEISAKWNALDVNDRKQFDEEAVHEKRRYRMALSQWKAQSKLDLKKLIAHQQQHIMASGDYVLTPLPSLVAQNKPDPNLSGSLSVQRHEVEARLMMQAQLQNAALFAEPRRMSMPTFTSSLVEGSAQSGKSASLPMSLHGSEGRQGEITSCHHGLSLSSVPPLGAGPRRMSMHTFSSSPLVQGSEDLHKSASLAMSLQGSMMRQGEATTRHHEPSLSSVPPLHAGPRRVSVPAFASFPPVEGSEESEEVSEKGTSLPMSLLDIMGGRFSLPEVTTCHPGQSSSSVPLLSSFGADCSNPAGFIEPVAYGGPGGNDAWMDGGNVTAFMAMLCRDANPTEDESDKSRVSMVSGMVKPSEPFSAIIATEEERDQYYGSTISCMLEPSPMRRSSMPCLPIDTHRFGEMQNSPSASMPISRVDEMKELREIIKFLDWELAKEDASNSLDDVE